jgi:benzoyl-CoA reductase subunit C
MISNSFLNISNTLENSHLKDWVSKGRKVLGYYCSNIPAELIHAAGFLPYRIRGIENTDYLQSDTVLSRFNCTFVRSTLNLAMNHKYDFLDGLLVMNSCDHIRRMYDIWIRKVEAADPKTGKIKMFFLSYPHVISDDAWIWMKDELTIFRKKFSETYNINISDKDIKSSMAIYKENEELLMKINNFREMEEPKLSGTEFFKIVIANDAVRKEYANVELKKILGELENKEPLEKVRARLMLVGSSSDNSEFIKILEHAGGLIVEDTLCTGKRSFIDENIVNYSEFDKNSLIDEQVRRTYGRIFCPRIMNGHQNRLKVIKEQIKKNKIDGIVLQRIEFCDMHGCENMLYQHELEEINIPVLSIDREYFLGDTGRLRTRIEAFLEKIGRY